MFTLLDTSSIQLFVYSFFTFVFEVKLYLLVETLLLSLNFLFFFYLQENSKIIQILKVKDASTFKALLVATTSMLMLVTGSYSFLI